MHKTKAVTVHGSQIEVDRHIARIVVWLNELPGVHTEWSCEGGDIQKPYVIFHCSEPESMREILDRLNVWINPHELIVLGKVEIGLCEDGFRYTMTFPCEEMRDLLTGRIKRSW